MSDNSDLFNNHQRLASDPNSQTVTSPIQTQSDDIFSRPFVPDTPEEAPAPESDFIEPTTPYGTPPELLESIDNSSELREKKKNNAEPIALVASILAVFFAGLSLYAFIAMGSSNAKNSKLITNFQNDLKHSDEIIAQYESATKTKVVSSDSKSDGSDTGDKNEKTPSDRKPQIVKWNDLNINFNQLVTTVGDNYTITGGRIVTNSDGTKVYAKLSRVKTENNPNDPNPLNPNRTIYSGAVSTDIYERDLPGGSWKYVAPFATESKEKCDNLPKNLQDAILTLDTYEPTDATKYQCQL